MFPAGRYRELRNRHLNTGIEQQLFMRPIGSNNSPMHRQLSFVRKRHRPAYTHRSLSAESNAQLRKSQTGDSYPLFFEITPANKRYVKGRVRNLTHPSIT